MKIGETRICAYALNRTLLQISFKTQHTISASNTISELSLKLPTEFAIYKIHE